MTNSKIKFTGLNYPSRRQILSGAVVGGAVALSGLSKPAIAQGVQQWAVASAFSAEGISGRALSQMCQSLSVALENQIQFDISFNSERVQPQDILLSLNSDLIQMGQAIPAYWRQKIIGADLITGFPFGLTADEMDCWLHEDQGNVMVQKLYDQVGVQFFAMGNTGNQLGGWFQSRLESAQDVQGLKMRSPGLAGLVWRELGAEVQNLFSWEVAKALEVGAIASAPSYGPAVDLISGVYENAKFLAYPGWQKPSLLMECMVSKPRFDTLSDSQKTCFAAVVHQYHGKITREFKRANALALSQLQEQYGIQLMAFGDTLLSALARASADVVASHADQGPGARKLYENMMEFRNRVGGFNSVAEAAFVRARQL